MQLTKNIAKFLSWVLHPLMMPFYGMVLFFNVSYLIIFPFRVRALVALGVLIFTYVIPAVSILVLYKLKIVKRLSLTIREERFWPYLICLICYVVCGLMLFKIRLPMWVSGYMAGGIIALIINILITLKWKVSAHLTGMGGLLGAAFALCRISVVYPPLLLLIGLILLTGMLGTSRILLSHHTLMQVIVGTANGFLSVYGGMMFFVI